MILKPAIAAVQLILAALVLGVVPHGSPVPSGALPPPGFQLPRNPSQAMPSVAETTRWAPPLGSPLIVSQAFRAPPTPYAAGHRGIDLPASPGDPVVAPESGTVSFSGIVADRGVLSIVLPDGLVYSLEPVVEAPSNGTPVLKGAVVATVGSGGHCGSGCLHLGVRREERYLNPMGFFRGKPVLMPW